MKRHLGHLWTLLSRSFQGFLADGGTQLAAAISYYVLFSLFPLAIVATSILGIVLQDAAAREGLIDAVVDTLPVTEDEGRQDVTDIIEGVTQRSTSAFGAIGIISLIWSGSGVFASVRRALNIINGSTGKRPVVRQKLTDFAMMLGLAVFFIASIAATAMLQAARDITNDIIFVSDIADAVGPAWTLVAILLPVLLSFGAFSILYWVVPAKQSRWRDAIPGAIFAAIAFEILKVGFSLYVSNFGNYDVVFGSLAAIVIFLFWVFLASNIMLFGAEIASHYPRVMRGDYDNVTDPEQPPVAFRTRVWRFVRGLVFHEELENLDKTDRRESQDRPS